MTRQRDLKFKMTESLQKSKGSVCQEDAVTALHQRDTLAYGANAKDLQEVDGLRYSSGWELGLVAHACPAPRTQRQDDHEFQASRGCNGILSQNSNTNKKNTTIVRDFQIPFSISDKLSRQNQQKNSGLHTLTKWTQNRIHRALSSTSCARPRQVEQLKKTNTMQMPFFIYLFLHHNIVTVEITGRKNFGDSQTQDN